VWCKAAQLRRCTFRGNRAWGYDAARGGAVYSENASFSDCVFEDNHAECPGAPRGGAIIDGGAPVIERCIFRGNGVDAHYFSSTGGAADAGSGTVIDCIFIDNFATCGQASGQGGALAGNQLTVRTSSFIGNEAKRTNPLGPGRGGALYLRFPSTVDGCTLIGNSGGTPDGIGGVHFEETGDVRSTLIAFTAVGVTCSGSVTWTCCDLFGNADGNVPCGTDAGGNFSADPHLCSSDPTTSGDVSIRSDSPCRTGGGPSRCTQIGAGGVGCETSAVEPRTWSAVKGAYR
jgi:Right handed beta helix region